MAENKSYTIHRSKKSLVDRGLHASDRLRTLLEDTESRLEHVADIDGVGYVNDARAVDLLSTRDTFKCVTRPIIWIAAAPAHERDYALIEKYVKYKVKEIVVYGGTADFMKRHVGHLVEGFTEAKDLKQAVVRSHRNAVKGDLVVFSPACLPHDGYRHFVERGDRFKTFIAEL